MPASAPPEAAQTPAPAPAALAPTGTVTTTTPAPVLPAIPAPTAERTRRPLSGRAKLLLLFGTVLAIVVFLWFVRAVVRPFIWAAVASYILSPVVGRLQRRLGVRRGVGVTIVAVTLLGLAAWGLTAGIPVLRSDVDALAASLGSINSYLSTYLPNAGTPVVMGVPIQVSALLRNAELTVLDLPRIFLRDGYGVATGAVGSLLRFLTFIISTFYLLLDAPRLGAWSAKRIPPGARGEVIALARRVNRVLSEYMRAEVILIVIMTVASLIAMTILGVHFALILAPIVGFLEIFPIVGPFFAISLVAVVALIGPANYGLSHVSFAVIVALVFFVLRQIEDYLVIPRVVGHAVKLHPVIILFALLCGAELGGILGMFLAVPVTGALKVVGSYVYDRLVE